MNIKKPLIRYAIDKIELLFRKNKDNYALIDSIEDELKNRHTKSSKNLIKKIQNTKKDILSNKSKAQINAVTNKDKSLEELLKSLSLKEFVQNNFVPMRVKNSILSEDDDFLEFDSVYSFILANKKDKQRLKRLDFFGEKSLNDLTIAIEGYIKTINKGDLDYSTPLPSTNLKSVDLRIPVDKEIIDSLSDEKIQALKKITLSLFVSSCGKIDVRVRNSILKADDLYGYENLYIFWVAPDKYKKKLLGLDNFGKGSLDNLVESIGFALNQEGWMANLLNIATKTSDIHSYKTIDELINYAVSNALSSRESLVVKQRHLDIDILTLQQIAVELGVTRERVRQIEAKAIKKIQGFVLSFPMEEVGLKFQNELKEYLFKDCGFISVNRKKDLIKRSKRYIIFYIKIFNESLEDFLNTKFFYSDKFNGWFYSGDTRRESEELSSSKECLNLNLAIQKSQWPITLSGLSELMSAPECIVKDMVSLSNNLYIEEFQNRVFIRLRKITTKNAVRYVLRRHKRGVSLSEVKDGCLEILGLDFSLRAIGAALGDLPDGLIVDTGTYALYENLNINKKQIAFVRSFCKTYLLQNQKYVSAFVIFNTLKNIDGAHEKYGDLDNGHILFGICQDDDAFITRQGFMIGLSSEKFTGEYMSLVQEVVVLMNKEDRPLSIKEIMDGLSSTRHLNWSSLFSMLDNDEHGIFEKIGSDFYLGGDQSHLEINDEDLFEVDIDDI